VEEDKSRELPVKHSGSHRTKSYLTRQQHAVRKFKYQYVEDDGDGHYDVVSNVVGNGRSSVATTSPKLGNFLPVATPYSRADPPSNDEGSVYIPESRSNFEAPGQIDVIQAPSYETRTDISDVTGLDFAVARQTNPRNHGVRTLYSPRSVEHTAPPVEYLQGLNIKSEQPWRTGALAKHRPPQIEIDLTSIETVEDAIKSVRNAESRSAIHVEKRHGLPYECTDFRADDECSEDSWGRAIVTPKENLLHSITSTREPIDVEKLFAEHSMPADTLSYVTDVETLIPRDVDIRDLIKETVSIEGDLVVDVSELREDHVQTLQSPKTKPQQALFNKITNEALAPVSFEQKPERMVGAEPPVTVSKHWTTTDNLAIDTILADHQSNPPSPLQLAALKSQVHNNDSVPSPSHANDFLFSSLETSTKYLKMLADGIGSQGKMLADGIGSQGKMLADGIGSQGKVLADGIGSQLSKLDSHLLPENEMNSMLGILDKDLKATSSKIPEGKEVVDYLDRQIKMNSVAAGDLLICTSAKNMTINFRANSIDEMVDNVKQTYEKNVAICVGSALEEQMPPPQTFIVPISLRGKDVDDSYEQQQSLRILSPRLVEK
jgi:hypothetical protein